MTEPSAELVEEIAETINGVYEPPEKYDAVAWDELHEHERELLRKVARAILSKLTELTANPDRNPDKVTGLTPQTTGLSAIAQTRDEPACKTCGKPVAGIDRYDNGAREGPWHRLCIPPKPEHFEQKLFAIKSEVACGDEGGG